MPYGDRKNHYSFDHADLVSVGYTKTSKLQERVGRLAIGALRKRDRTAYKLGSGADLLCACAPESCMYNKSMVYRHSVGWFERLGEMPCRRQVCVLARTTTRTRQLGWVGRVLCGGIKIDSVTGGLVAPATSGGGVVAAGSVTGGLVAATSAGGSEAMWAYS
ncbi:unnamed protein product [Sphagnum balticum]